MSQSKSPVGAIVAAVAVVVLAVGAFAAYKFGLPLLGRSGSVGLIGDLDAAHTVAVFEIRHVDRLLKTAAEEFQKVPKETLKDINLKDLQAKLGFDPLDPAAWGNQGVDLDAGVALVFDDRLLGHNGKQPEPLVLLKLTDKAKLLALLKRGGIDLKEGKKAGDLQQYLAGDSGGIWIAQRGDAAVISVSSSDSRDAPNPALTEFLKPAEQKLASAAHVKRMVSDGGDLVFAVYSDTKLAAGLVGKSQGKANPDIDFFAGLFPYTALFAGDSGGLRAGASEEGRAALKMVLVPDKAPPKCARWFGKSGWAATRLSLNLKDMFNGAGKFLPPSVPSEARAAPAMAPGAFAMVSGGTTWGELTDAFSGHFCVGTDLKPIATAVAGEKSPDPQGLAIIGLVDRPKAEALVKKLVDFFGPKLPAPPKPTEVDGAKGYEFAAGPVKILALFEDDALVIATSADMFKAGKARSKGDSMAATELADDIDGKVVWSFAIDAAPFADLLAAQGKKLGQDAAGIDAMVAKLRTGGVGSVRLDADDEGLYLHSQQSGAAAGVAVVGILAAVAVPQFTKYTRTAKAAEANEMLDLMKKGAATYYLTPRVEPGTINKLPCQFPASVPLTPGGASCCAEENDADNDERCDSKPATWNHATWSALKFAITDQHFFQYKFESSGTGAEAIFTATAHGDLDCDGVFSTFQLTGRGTVGADGECDMDGRPAEFRDNETE